MLKQVLLVPEPDISRLTVTRTSEYIYVSDAGFWVFRT